MSEETTDQVLGIIDYDKIPLPTVIEDVKYETIFNEMVAAFRLESPEYVNLLESDPIMKLIGTHAYRELLLRQRINDAARANMLPFATGSDLDMLGAFYEVKRNILISEDLTVSPIVLEVMESDGSYRERIRDRLRGWSTAGGEYHYKFWARKDIAEVFDVAVSSPTGGKVKISVMSTVGDALPSDELLAEVQAQVERPDVVMLTDTVEVVKPTQVPLDVVAVITLLSDTPTRVFDEIVNGFETSFKSLQKLGRDVTRGWLLDVMFVEGVYNVDLPSPLATLVIDDHEYPVLNSVSITFGGRKE